MAIMDFWDILRGNSDDNDDTCPSTKQFACENFVTIT